MHARCDTDPLDFATDVCEHCGGEHCDEHLVRPYGPERPPLCRSCAIALSGVRTGGAPARKRNRSQIKRRRAELRAQVHQGRPTLAFDPFWTGELADRSSPRRDRVPAPADVPSEPVADRRAGRPATALGASRSGSAAAGAGTAQDPPGRGRGGRRFGLGRRRTDDPAVEPAAEPDTGTTPIRTRPGPTPAPSSATVLLTRLRESGAVPLLPAEAAGGAAVVASPTSPRAPVGPAPGDVAALAAAAAPTVATSPLVAGTPDHAGEAPVIDPRADARATPTTSGALPPLPRREPAAPRPEPRAGAAGIPHLRPAPGARSSPERRPPRGPIGSDPGPWAAPAVGPDGRPEPDDPWGDVPPALQGPAHHTPTS